MADTGVQPMTTGDSIEKLSPTTEDTDSSPTTETISHDRFSPLPMTEEIRRIRHTDVSLDPRYNHRVSLPPPEMKNAPQHQAAS